MAAELYPHGVAVVAITPGFLRSERMLEHFGVTEKTWRDGGEADKNFLTSESPLYVGRAVAALAQDPNIMKRTGQLLSSWELSREYKFTDADGSRPDWGKIKIDLSGLPPGLADYIHIGNELQLQWLETVTKRSKSFAKQLPRTAGQKKQRSKSRTRSTRAKTQSRR
jgi:hypothetical protein